MSDNPLQVTDWTPSDELRPVGNTVLVVVDIQGGGLENPYPGNNPALTYMPGREVRNPKAVELVTAFRARQVPVIFIQEVHKPSLIDIGRELDGSEGPHCIEGEQRTELHPGLEPRPEEYLIRKRRYSAFFGTELDLLLRGYKAETVILIGGMTDVCIHYTAVDAHQLDYHFRTVSDLVVGSGQELHDAALRAMKYLQRDSLVSSTAVYDWLETVSIKETA
ncbi:isochorismatase family cysteine hydrolase [Kineosporia sp. NBRC 101731]|uniref:cysteine hydrolase family protein n=1 Tax=Kineosporia sp. NBRC 101731 TaxID=3032199 RepID=UPI00249FAAAC|nr:isochorismatase family cysteine hydrolase [Kineosporia sp. NBRC 101731]GLY33008.1 isochorismatase [Kineosporia sp. NBRC 101731]